MEFAPRDPLETTPPRIPLLGLVSAALTLNFQTIHELPDAEQRRAGLLGIGIGGVLVLAGLYAFAALVRLTGFQTKYFGLIAGWGGIVAGIGAYRVGVSFLPGLRGQGTLASLGRMSLVLVVLSAIGAIAVFVLIRDP